MQTIRYATPSDANALAKLAETTFRDTFASTNSIEDLNLHCQAKYGEAIQLAEIKSSDMTALLCEADGALIAYSQLRWHPAPACVSAIRPGEIQRFYVDDAWHGKGIAQELMKRCFMELKQRNSDFAWLGVWERNPKAIAFYKKFGFIEIGSHVFPLGTDPQRDIIMARAIGTSTSDD
jgi:ribosomal protein S18 acetylase RimI-like enzyme